jgi:hypothetical protein
MMDVSRIAESSLYKEFKTELQICNIGGLFLALYQDEKIIELIIKGLKEDLPDYFVFQLQMSDQKVAFPTFFEQTFSQMGKKSNIFFVTGIERLPEKLRLKFIDYLQNTRERFKAKPYSIVFWITPQFEEQLFSSAPDFHHWISGTYNLEELSTRPLLLEMIMKTLPGLKDKKKINVSRLYKSYTDIWIEREDWRSKMTPVEKRSFMWKLAFKMFKKGYDFSVHFSELFEYQNKFLEKNIENFDSTYYKYETTTCSFLNRDQEGNYKFIHNSFMEFFLAENYFYCMKKREKRIMPADQLNKEAEYFLKLIISSEKSDLQNLDLSHLNLKNANMQGVDLSDAKNITYEMLLGVKSLYQVKGLDPEIEKRLRESKPELFEKPGE